MNRDFLELAKKRKVTYEFSNKEIKKEDMHKILEAMRWAPSCGNTQPWLFTVINKKENIKKILESTQFIHFPFISPMPKSVIACILDHSCLKNSEHTCTPKTETGRRDDAQMCVAMAALQGILQAEDSGINSCILTPDREEARKIMAINDDQEVVLYIGLGYEKKEAYQKKKERKKLSEIVSYEIQKNKNNSRIKIKKSTATILFAASREAYARLQQSIIRDKEGVYIALHTPPYKLKKFKNEKIFFINASGETNEKMKNGVDIKGPTSLTELSIKLADAMAKKTIKNIFIDSITDLLINNKQEVVEEFLYYLISKSLNKNIALIGIARGDEKTRKEIAFIEQFCTTKTIY
ncbi:MAG: hypothetical protein RL557_383 [archaeon]|jgi:nitroreductase